MKFSMSKNELSELVSCVQSVVPLKPVRPILSNFLLEANSEGLKLIATDMTVGICCFLPIEVQQEGATTLPSRKFFQLIRELTAPEIEIAVSENDTCQLQALSSKFKLNGMPKGEFPAFPDLADSVKITLNREDLKEMIFKTLFAVSKDENRYLMTGILFKVESGKLILVGTDARRLAKTTTPIDIDPSFQGEYIVPTKGMEEIAKILDKSSDETICLHLTKERIAVETSHIIITSKLLVGDFPDFKSVIPTKTAFEVLIHREELMGLLRQISIFTQEAGGACQFFFDSGELKISSAHHQIGEGVVSMVIDFSHDPLSIAFNPQHVIDVLRHSKDEIITFKCIDAFNPMLIQDSSSALFIVMPMRKQ